MISRDFNFDYIFLLGRGGNRGGSQYKPSDRNATNEDEKPPDLEKEPPDDKSVEELAATIQPNPQTNSSVNAVADDATAELVKAISVSGNAASEVSQNGEKLDDAAPNGEPPKNVNSGQVC